LAACSSGDMPGGKSRPAPIARLTEASPGQSCPRSCDAAHSLPLEQRYLGRGFDAEVPRRPLFARLLGGCFGGFLGDCPFAIFAKALAYTGAVVR
jgi:hypothetical protein